MANVGKAKVTVPRRKKVAGRDHMLAFITPDEAQLLNRRAGRPGTTVVTGKNNVPTFIGGVGGVGAATGGGQTSSAAAGQASAAGVGGGGGGNTGGDAGGGGFGNGPSPGDVVSSAGAGLGETAGDPGAITGAADTGGNATTGNSGAPNPPPSGRVGDGPDAVGQGGSQTVTGGSGGNNNNVGVPGNVAGGLTDISQSRQARSANITPSGEVGLVNTAENVLGAISEGEELDEDEERGLIETGINAALPGPVTAEMMRSAAETAGPAITGAIESITGTEAQGAQAVDISSGRGAAGPDGGPPNEQPRPTEGRRQPRRTEVPTRETATQRAAERAADAAEEAFQGARGAGRGTILAGGLTGRTSIPSRRIRTTMATGG